MDLKEELRELAMAQGFQSFGVAEATPPESIGALDEWLAAGRHGTMEYMARNRDLRADPARLLPGVRSVVIVSLNYYQDRDEDPKIARYALGRDYHRVFRQRLKPLAKRLTAQGHEARICVDSAPILEREYAHRAGLGWFGKNTMLIDSRRGSWFLLGALLTTALLEADSRSVGGCGTCRACIEACPTGAIVFDQDRWQIDARQCISYQTIEKKGDLTVDTHGWVFGCDVCQEVCPFNQPRASQPVRASMSTVEDFTNRRPWPSAEVLATLGDQEWEGLSAGTAVRRTGLAGIRRNATTSRQTV